MIEEDGLTLQYDLKAKMLGISLRTEKTVLVSHNSCPSKTRIAKET
jgi:hypothetical protein